MRGTGKLWAKIVLSMPRFPMDALHRCRLLLI
jgi:hypothetical protein